MPRSDATATPPTLLYLSGAPRVSTLPESTTVGARSHILGVIGAFERQGWKVDRFIAGDRLPAAMRSRAPSTRTSPLVKRIGADLVRLAAGLANRSAITTHLDRRPTWVYERFASMQSLGGAARSRGVPWILETQGPFFREAGADRNSMALTSVARRLELRAYRECDVLICVSKALRDLLLDLAPIDPQKVLVVPNGVDVTFFDPARVAAIRLTPASTFTIGYVGGLPRWQGLDRLFRSVARVRAQIGELAVVVVGDGQARLLWEADAAQLGLSELVHWVGRVPRDCVPSYLRGFDAGYSGQVDTGLGGMYHSPLKLYEYQAMGLPIVASDFDDARSLLATTRAGQLFDPDDASGGSLDRAITEAAAAHRAGRYGACAIRSAVVAEHSWDQRVAGLVRGVRSVLVPRGAP